MATVPAGTKKQELNVYTVMLITSGISLIFGCVCLWMALNSTGTTYPYWKTNDARIQVGP
ncbi:MAG TPA: hypothetical protein DCQ98_08905 [Planctomycetaceae bacterium]|nr:hypothetical protein [Planctomycetaceae bacterium]HRF02093.1 hypothetical protein [Pirellulaceae bacterium]